MKNKFLFLFVLSLAAIATLLGCHAGGNAPFINVSGESNIVSMERIVNENGRFADITFPSGAVIKCTQDGTLKKGTKITATEQKISDGNPSYIYNITANLITDEALKTAVSVNTLEKPISVTLPNNSTTGTCYIGTRASDNDPWHYSLATDGLADIRFARLQASTPSQCNFNLYRFGIDFALFVLNNQSKEEAEVDSVEITPTEDVEYKDEKYVADLNIKVKVSGEKLDGIKPDNLKARIVYRSDSLNPEQLKANGSIVKQTDSDDKAVSGTYEHSFEISNIKIESQMSGEAVVGFVLNLDGVSLKAFPTSFLVEFYSDGKAENTLPFIYTQAFSFETKEQQNEPEPLVTYSITYELDGGEPTGNNPTNYTIESEITLSNPTKDGYTFLGWTGSNGNTPEETVIIAKGSTGDRNYKANWQQNAPDTYTLTLVAGTGIASVDENKAYKADESITLNYTLKDGYEFDKWVDSEGNAVTSPFTMPAKDMTLTANAKPITYTITLDPNGGTVEYTTKEYNVETAEFILPKATKDYYTFDGWVLNGGDPVETVTITKGTHENRTYKAKFTPATYTITLDPNGGTVEYTSKEYNVETAEFTLPTPTRTGYKFFGWILEGETTPVETVIIANGSTGAKTYTANWKLNLTLTIASDTGSVFEPVANNLYKLSPTFSITPDVVLTDSEKANIISAISVIDSNSISLNTISKSWVNGKIVLSFNEALNASSTYTISCGDIENVNLICTPLSFTTICFSGSGTKSDPFKVENAAQLDFVRNYLDKHYIQTADIDLGAYTENWSAIGADSQNGFIGSYYGNGKTIKNLTVHSSENVDNVGLFGFLNNGAKIASLTIDGISVYGADTNTALNTRRVGFIAFSVGKQCSAEFCNVINSSNNKSKVFTSSNWYVGGICAENEGSIVNCSVSNIDIKNTNTYWAGGICGLNYGSITGSSFEKSNFEVFLGTDWDNSFGGICGYNCGNISLCYVDNESSLVGDANGNSNGFYIGGICGFQMASKDLYSLTDCYIDNVTISGIGENCRIGGIFGMSGNVSNKNFTRVKDCHIYNSLVEGTGDYNSIGGIGGSNYGEVISCYTQLATATVKVSNESSCNTCNIGGIVGENCECPISKSYALNSSVIGNNSSRVGGISGWSNGTIEYSYVMNNDLKSGSECFIGGITGVNDGGGYIGSCYVLNSNFNTGNQSKIGGLVGESQGATIKSSYFSNDGNQNIIKGDSCNFGYIGGYVWNYSEVKNCFYRQSEDPFFGYDGNTISENNYKGISSYGEFTTDNSSPRTWSDGAWNDFKVGADKPWPLDLNDNPRP